MAHTGTRVILDLEADDLNATKIHLIITKDIDTNVVRSYKEGDWDQFRLDSRDYTLVIGHNILGFDRPCLRRLLNWNYDGKFIDTLILSRLLKYNIDNGHSLEAWGNRLKHPKLTSPDFSTYSEAMYTYCLNDVELNHRLYLYLTEKLGRNYDNAIDIEHEVQMLLDQATEHGFPYNMEKHKELYDRIAKEVAELDELIVAHFPPRPYSLGEYIPRLTKHGTIARTNLRWWRGDDFSVFTDGVPFIRLGWELFNPNSNTQVVQRLTDNEWWEPVERTDGYVEAVRERNQAKINKLEKYGWKLSERNLATLKDSAPPACQYLVRRMMLRTRLSTLDQWSEAYDARSGSIHANIQSLGTWTHRASHRRPNLANIAAPKSIKYKSPELSELATQLGKEMRKLFWNGGKDEVWLVGTDADGIQLRLFAHFANDQRLIEANVNGKKEDKTDVHSLNQQALGEVCRDRDTAKTWIYAYLLGAGRNKLASILGCSPAEADRALDRLLATYQSIAELRRNRIPRDANRGYFEGVDGRFVCCDSEHHMLAGYLQEGESTVMKYAMRIWHKEADAYGYKFQLVNWIHDEWQTLVWGNQEDAERIGALQAQAITRAGIDLNIKCPLSGSFRVGRNWLETH